MSARRRLALLALAALTSAAACAEPERAPATITMAQAETLAQVRMRAYEQGGARLTATVPTGARTAVVEARVDWRRHEGRARLSLDGRQGADLAWNLRAVAVADPQGAWRARPLDPEGQPVDRALLMLLNLAGNRPDNPQLLQRNQAAWLRSDEHRGLRVDVFRGPAVRTEGRTVAPGQQQTFYWVDGGGLLRRFEAVVTAGAAPAVIDLTAYGRQSVALPEILLSPRPAPG